jgi:hypothetical protein
VVGFVVRGTGNQRGNRKGHEECKGSGGWTLVSTSPRRVARALFASPSPLQQSLAFFVAFAIKATLSGHRTGR